MDKTVEFRLKKQTRKFAFKQYRDGAILRVLIIIKAKKLVMLTSQINF